MKYAKYAAAAEFVRALGWKMDACGDAAIVYPTRDGGIALADVDRALNAALTTERTRAIDWFCDRLSWSGDGYEWAPMKPDYREDPRAAAIRALERRAR